MTRGDLHKGCTARPNESDFGADSETMADRIVPARFGVSVCIARGACKCATLNP